MDVSRRCPDISWWILPISGVSYMTGFLGVVTLFTNRIIISFRNTRYETSPHLLTILKMIGVFFVVLAVGLTISGAINVVSSSISGGIMIFGILLLFFLWFGMITIIFTKIKWSN